MNGVCFKVSGGTSVPKLPTSSPPPSPPRSLLKALQQMLLLLNSHLRVNDFQKNANFWKKLRFAKIPYRFWQCVFCFKFITFITFQAISKIMQMQRGICVLWDSNLI